MRPITKREWREYEWTCITEAGDESPVYLRGAKLKPPPNDEYEYDEVTRIEDTEQRWARRMTPE